MSKEVLWVLSAQEAAISSCVKKQRQGQPNLTGKLVMRWLIHKNGSAKNVSCVSEALCSTYLARCLTALIQRWTFPAHAAQDEMVNYPFAF